MTIDNRQLILVNEQDQQIGTTDKFTAHRLGLLHRAFSVFLFNEKGDFLLQKRALDKYHTPGLWSNTCCSHPCDGENIMVTAGQRLQEEMGIIADLKEVFSSSYRAEFKNGLIEHEVDHVFVGSYEGLPSCNPLEACNWCYRSLAEIEAEMMTSPNKYTPWFRKIYINAYRCFKALPFGTELI